MTLPLGKLLDEIDLHNGWLTELAVSADWQAFTQVQQARDALLSTLDSALDKALAAGDIGPDQARQRVLHIREVNVTLADLADVTKASLEGQRIELERTARALQAYQQGAKPDQQNQK